MLRTALPRLTRAVTLLALTAPAASSAAAPPAARAVDSSSRAPRVVTLTDGDKPIELALLPQLVLSVHAAPDLPARDLVLAPAWRGDGAGRWIGEVADEESGARVTLRLQTAGAAELSAEVLYGKRAWISLAAIDLSLPGRAQVLDRDLTMRPAPPVAYLDRFSTKKLRAGEVTALVDDGIDGVIVRRASGAKEPTTEIRVELLSAEARPFLHDARCRDDWRSDNPKLARPARLREAGEHDAMRMELHADDGPVLAKSRWPEGRDAALVITDHADQSSPDTFAALALGRSDAEQPVGGLLGHHLVITKSLFVRGEVNGEGRRQLEDARVTALATQMARAGSEIIPHSVTPDPDERDATAAGLDRFDRFKGATWIDHQPETNCEAFTNQGWRGAGDLLGGRWRIADLLARHGYRYIWSAIDQDEMDLVGAGHLDKRALTIWPLGRLAIGDPDDRWLFKTNWGFFPVEQMFRDLGPERLDRMERDHGLALLHTYLESLHSGDNPRFAGRNVLRRRSGIIETTPRLEKLFDDLQRRIEGGTLWMPTMVGLGDWLQQLDRVRVRYASDGKAVIQSPVDVTGLTLHVPGDVDVLTDGKPPRGRRLEKNGTLFWFDVKANRPVKIEMRARPEPNADGRELPGTIVKFVASAHAE